jgi:hypothetical protein
VKAVWLTLALTASACAPTLVAQSAPPAGRVARLDSVDGFWGVKSYRLELSTGVALALHCYRGGPCEKMEVRSDSPNVEVRLASIGTLEKVGYTHHQTPAAGFVVIGKAPGPAKLTVRTQGKTREVAVTVVPPPSPAPPAKLAR